MISGELGVGIGVVGGDDRDLVFRGNRLGGDCRRAVHVQKDHVGRGIGSEPPEQIGCLHRIGFVIEDILNELLAGKAVVLQPRIEAVESILRGRGERPGDGGDDAEVELGLLAIALGAAAMSATTSATPRRDARSFTFLVALPCER